MHLAVGRRGVTMTVVGSWFPETKRECGGSSGAVQCQCQFGVSTAVCHVQCAVCSDSVQCTTCTALGETNGFLQLLPPRKILNFERWLIHKILGKFNKCWKQWYFHCWKNSIVETFKFSFPPSSKTRTPRDVGTLQYAKVMKLVKTMKPLTLVKTCDLID